MLYFHFLIQSNRCVYLCFWFFFFLINASSILVKEKKPSTKRQIENERNKNAHTHIYLYIHIAHESVEFGLRENVIHSLTHANQVGNWFFGLGLSYYYKINEFFAATIMWWLICHRMHYTIPKNMPLARTQRKETKNQNLINLLNTSDRWRVWNRE